MGTVAITVQTVRGNFMVTVGAGDLDIVFTAADVGNGNYYISSGKEFLIVRNVDVAAPYTFTLTSQVDPQGRLGHITTYSLAAADYAVYGPIPKSGWADTASKVHLTGSNVKIEFAIIKAT